MCLPIVGLVMSIVADVAIVICDCGNSVKEDGAYVGACEDCEEVFCIECLIDCDGCKKSICYGGENEKEDPCAIVCEGVQQPPTSKNIQTCL